jgi:hypothetical protein
MAMEATYAELVDKHRRSLQEHFLQVTGLTLPIFYLPRKYLQNECLRDVPLLSCLHETTLSTDFVVIAVERSDGKDLPDVWGLHRVMPLMVACWNKTMIIPLIKEADCYPDTSTLHGAQLYHEVLQSNCESTVVNLDQLAEEMAQRLVQYGRPTDAGCADLTVRSFLMAAAAVHYAPPHRKQSILRRFVEHEMALAKYRLSRSFVHCSLPDFTSFAVETLSTTGAKLMYLMQRQIGTPVIDDITGQVAVNPRSGSPVLSFPISFPADQPGMVSCTSIALWCWSGLEKLEEELRAATEVPRTALIIHPGVKHVINLYTQQLYKHHLQAPPTKHRKAGNATMNVIAAVTPVPDLEDLVTLMPACMRIMHRKMAQPTDKDHYKRDKRRLFHNYVLANGVRPEAYRDFVLKANSQQDSAYQKKLYTEVNQPAAELAKEVKDWTGCKCAPCPFLPKNEVVFEQRDYQSARVQCHDEFLKMANLQRDPDKFWFSSPLHFTQRLAQLRKVARAQKAEQGVAASAAKFPLSCGCAAAAACSCASRQQPKPLHQAPQRPTASVCIPMGLVPTARFQLFPTQNAHLKRKL